MSAALPALGHGTEDRPGHHLIWTVQSGPGKNAVRELLFNPSRLTEGKTIQPAPLPPATQEGNPSSDTGRKYQGNGHDFNGELPKTELPVDATRHDGWHSPTGLSRAENDDDPAVVRELVQQGIRGCDEARATAQLKDAA